MKKIIKLTVLSVVCALLLASCSTFNEGAIGTFPMRDIPVRSIEDLQSGSFEILGTVTGTGNVDAKDPEDGDSLGYGSLEVLDVDRMYFGIDKMPDLEDPYAVSLANAPVRWKHPSSHSLPTQSKWLTEELLQPCLQSLSRLSTRLRLSSSTDLRFLRMSHT